MTIASPRELSVPTRDVLEGLSRLHPFVLLTDRMGRIQWMSDALAESLFGRNRSWCREHGRDGEKLIRELLRDLPEPAQLVALREALLARRRAERMPLDLSAGDGGRMHLEVSSFLVGAESEDAARYVIIVRPEDEERAGVPALPDTLELLRGLLESAPDAVVATDCSGFVTYANPAVEHFVNCEAHELLGKPIALFMPTSRTFGELLEKFRERDSWDAEEFSFPREDGRLLWTSISARPLRLADGSRVGWVTMIRDVTRSKERQRELERRNAELESYADSVAHDLRSPLVSLLGFTRLLRQDYEDVLDKTGHHFLDRVEQAGRTMETLIHDLLDLSRIGRHTERGPLADPCAVLQQLGAELKLRLEEQSAVLVLPEQAPMMWIDTTRLYQVFSNLVGNALAHMGPCETPRIEVQILEDEGQHEIVVIDNGRGVESKDRERIFEIFKTGRSHRDSVRSAGIGLALVKKIAETHGGRAWVDSAPGAGARFHVRIPAP